MKSLIKMAVFLGLVFGPIFGFIAYRNHMIDTAMASYERPPVTVAVSRARADTWERVVRSVGTVSANLGTDLSTEVEGVVREILFQPGEQVEAGAPLVQLDDRVEQANLKSYQAQLRLAQINYERDQTLLQSKAISRTDFDTVEAELRDIEAQVEATRALIAKKRIAAPFAGQVGVSRVKVGEYVHKGDPLTTLQALDSLYIEFSLPERYLTALALGQSVRFSIDAWPGHTFDATVRAIDAKVDDNTRSILVRADVAPTEQPLLPGMFANVRVVLDSAVPVISVPQTAITYSLFGDSVFVVRTREGDGQTPKRYVERVYVTPGQRQGNRVAIDEGLAAGDTVVTAGQIKLSNGARVRIDDTPVPGVSAD